MPLPLQRFAPFLVALPLAACGSLDLRRAAAVPTSLVAHQLCSATFVSRAEPERFYREAIAPDVAPVRLFLRHHVDREKGEVTASFAGLVRRRAVYREALGCLVVRGAAPAATPIHLDPPAPALLPAIAGPDLVEPASPALKAALDRAFAEPATGPHRWTKAVIIVHDGRIVGERYAPGYGIDTPLTGWSMTKSVTKSVTNALLGVLVREGRLDMGAWAPLAAWSDPKDPHHPITADSLLRMTSGMEFGQSLSSNWKSAFDPSSQMLFAVDDMAAAAARAPVIAPPGARWTYTDGNTAILSRIVRDAAGGDAQQVLRFAHRELFDKLGMAHATLEFDATGAPLGATHLWAPARDWARFGMLYLNDGVVGGERILPKGWVDYSARFTPGSEGYGYGAGFWTNRPDPKGVRLRTAMPADSFMARGSHGQAIVISPSARLVVVRLGDAYTPYGDIAALNRLVADATAALAPASQAAPE
jgi:CubicO group peptidase (beta-lactamase class C family)